jgi:L-threonylcarbamoyladenylate synthase
MPVLPVDARAPDPSAVTRAAEVLRAGGLVAFPTETVYGLGADAMSDAAVRRVFAAKGRPADNPLIVHLADAGDIGKVAAEVTPLAAALAARWWPGPLTLVLTARPEVPAVTTGGLATVAVRVPDHPIARALIAAADVPVAAPSANRSGRPSPTTAAHVVDDLGDAVDLIVDGGPCRVGLESTVVDARGAVPVILREGAITREDLGVTGDVADADRAASPGTRHAHYQPDCAVRLAPPGGAVEVAAAEVAAGRRVGLVAAVAAPAGVLGITRFADAGELGARLYDALRAAEAAGLDVVVVEAVAEVGLGRAVMDRLRRAAAPR